MNIRDSVVKCIVCKSGKEHLKYLGIVSHYDQYLDSITDKETIICKECDTIHYFEGGKLTYQFYPTIIYGKKTF